MSFPRYQKYKDSGVEWLGQMPEHWAIKPLYSSATERNESNKGMIENNLLSLSYGRIVRKDISSNDGLLPESFETYQIVRPGDIVFRPTDLQNDWNSLRSAIVEETGIITSAYIAVTSIGPNPKYLSYMFRAYDAMKVFYSMGGGLRQSMKYSELKRLPILVAPLHEQARIAAFLDRETAKIDELVAEQKRLIELLKEKRQAIISHAVTKGLNPSAPMKHSGIEWLGDVPTHWIVIPLRRVVNKFVDYRGKTPSISETGIPLVTASAIRDGKVTHSRAPSYITQETYNKWMVRGFPEVGDVVFTTEGATFGETGRIVDASVALAQRIILFKADKSKVSNGFLFYHFMSDFGRAEQWSNTTGTTVFGIKASKLKATNVIVPPLSEQDDIVQHIERETRSFDVAEAQAAHAIELLQERRTALISAAVTGQIKIN